MNKLYVGFTLVFIASLFSATFLLPASPANAAGQHGFSVKQYEAFHDVLHPLEHEALPKNDFRTIRAKSSQLVSRGNAIVRLGVPRGTAKDQRAEFKTGLRKFSQALVKFRADARRGTDDQLRLSYSAVHDTFEMLLGMLPR